MNDRDHNTENTTIAHDEKEQLISNQSSNECINNSDTEHKTINNQQKCNSKKTQTAYKERPKSIADIPNYRVYKSRWLMLLIFCLSTMLNGSMFMGLSPVVGVVGPYYNVSAVNIEWLSNMFMVVYIFVAMPSAFFMSKHGVRAVLTIASGCGAAGAALQYGGYKRRSYLLVVAGQFFAAIAYSNLIQVPGKLSAVWFAPKERGISTSIGVFMNILGVAIGFVQPAHMIPNTDNFDEVESGIRNFFLSKLIIAILVFSLTAFAFREHPPTPPCYTHVDGPDEPGFKDSLCMMVKDRNFMMMAQAYGIYYGLYVSVSVVVSPLVLWRHEQTQDDINGQIGWMGFSCNIAAVVSCYMLGIFLDRTSRYKGVAVFLNGCSAMAWLTFIMILTRTTSFKGVFAVYVVFGFTGIPYFASGVEQAAEMTFPVPEGTSSTLILQLGNMYGFSLILGLGSLAEKGYHMEVLYIILGLYVLSTLLLCLSKTELKRSKSENAWINDELQEGVKGKRSDYGTNKKTGTSKERWAYIVWAPESNTTKHKHKSRPNHRSHGNAGRQDV